LRVWKPVKLEHNVSSFVIIDVNIADSFSIKRGERERKGRRYSIFNDEWRKPCSAKEVAIIV